mgnify:CR=1 FL=1
MRYGNWKFLFTSQEKWFNGEVVQLTSPVITRLDLDPFERAEGTRGFDEWQENRSWAIGPAMALLQKFSGSFKDYPARQASFSPDTSRMVEMMMSTAPQ